MLGRVVLSGSRCTQGVKEKGRGGEALFHSGRGVGRAEEKVEGSSLTGFSLLGLARGARPGEPGNEEEPQTPQWPQLSCHKQKQSKLCWENKRLARGDRRRIGAGLYPVSRFSAHVDQCGGRTTEGTWEHRVRTLAGTCGAVHARCGLSAVHAPRKPLPILVGVAFPASTLVGNRRRVGSAVKRKCTIPGFPWIWSRAYIRLFNSLRGGAGGPLKPTGCGDLG